ncbi:twin-arginine translocase subunit TatC [Archaeoglobus veneficus]|uniref:Sec-independent protein translocase protein TatC n=1 Tax=Archaeoglobus veneficus (strain DSM 11195 / SNP6) TaxID=693661 RepID=F2KQ26_ARCVS|nr:twin-arginine translocase subunit TatC [Archaeoglobus veneficus]AEA47629.1 Sec-independent periplasmic protein translocase [Archaeoglobus veneficus SNP6]
MADFTASEAAEVLLAIRMKLIKVLAIIAITWAIVFAFVADPLLTKVVDDLYPGNVEQSRNLEEISHVSSELKRIASILDSYVANPNNESAMKNASQALKELSKIALKVSASPIYLRPLEGLILKLKISLIFGIVVALPYILHLSYRTLKTRTDLLENVSVTKSQAVRYGLVSAILFVLGVIYGYFLLKFFLVFLYGSAEKQGVIPLYSLSEFVSFVVLMLTIFGIVFQMPLVMLFLVGNSIVEYRTLTYYRRHFYVTFFVIGAAITPPDVFTQLMVALPMVVFFELSLLLTRIVHRDKIKGAKV